MKKILKISTKFIGLVIFVIILYKTNWEEIGLIFTGINFVKLIPIYLLVIPGCLLMSYRWHFLLKKVSIRRTFFNNMKLLYSGILMGVITPGRIGELYPVFRLNKEGYSKAKGIFVIILGRLFDIGMLVISSIISVYFVVALKNSDAIIIKLVLWAGLLIILLFFCGIFTCGDYIAEKSRVFLKKIFKLGIDREKILNNIKKLDFSLFIKSGLVTVSIWSIYFFQLYLFGNSIGIEISFLSMFFILALVSLAASLPITFVGLGTREFAMINLLMVFEIAREKALAVSLMSYSIMMANLLIAAILWGLEYKKLD